MNSKQEIGEEHMLVNKNYHKELLKQYDLSNVTVVEFGAGDGALTELILACHPQKLIAYELNASLAGKLKIRLNAPVLEIRVTDFTQENFDYLNNDRHIIISNPPYSTIPFLFEKVIKPFNIEDVIMMTSLKKKEQYFSDYELEFTLSGNDFSPPAKGEHLVMRKGFEELHLEYSYSSMTL